MEIIKGIEFRVEVEDINKFAQCLLVFTNIKCSRGAVIEVETIEGTDFIKVIGKKEHEEALVHAGKNYGKVIDEPEDIAVMIVEDEDIEGKTYNKLLDEHDQFYIAGKFSNF